MEFRVVVKTPLDKEFARYEKVTSPEHACNRIIHHITQDKYYGDCQWFYELECIEDGGEWKPWSDETYANVGEKIVELMEEENE